MHVEPTHAMEARKIMHLVGGTHNDLQILTSTHSAASTQKEKRMLFQATNPRMSTATMTAAWPPPSLATIDVEALVNDCEEAEASGQERPFATVQWAHLSCLFAGCMLLLLLLL